MAPFNTHFLIAEKIWPDLDGPWQPQHYDQFCFGCVAPDVDKLSTQLTQKDTHFFDRTGPRELMASHRSATFLQQQRQFLGRPFSQLDPGEQAFVLGYLCHLCVDEVSKHMWQRGTWIHFVGIGPGPAFAALDGLAHTKIKDYRRMANAFKTIEALDVIPAIPLVDLEAFLSGVKNFVHANTVEDEFLALIDMFDRPPPEIRCQKLRDFREAFDAAQKNIYRFRLDDLVNAGLNRSRQRLTDLLAGRAAEPGFPSLSVQE